MSTNELDNVLFMKEILVHLYNAFKKDVVFHVVNKEKTFHPFMLNVTIKRHRKAINMTLIILEHEDLSDDDFLHVMDTLRMPIRSKEEEVSPEYTQMATKCMESKHAGDDRKFMAYVEACKNCFETEYDRALGNCIAVLDEARIRHKYNPEGLPTNYFAMLADENLEADLFVAGRMPRVVPKLDILARQTRKIPLKVDSFFPANS